MRVASADCMETAIHIYQVYTIKNSYEYPLGRWQGVGIYSIFTALVRVRVAVCCLYPFVLVASLTGYPRVVLEWSRSVALGLSRVAIVATYSFLRGRVTY